MKCSCCGEERADSTVAAMLCLDDIICIGCNASNHDVDGTE
jgi:hypothetical protein